jgi:hypothetical protein
MGPLSTDGPTTPPQRQPSPVRAVSLRSDGIVGAFAAAAAAGPVFVVRTGRMKGHG